MFHVCDDNQVALFGSIFDGKAFREWVSPAVLKAYQWQVSKYSRTNFLYRLRALLIDGNKQW